jgi:hypothetical protein
MQLVKHDRAVGQKCRVHLSTWLGDTPVTGEQRWLILPLAVQLGNMTWHAANQHMMLAEDTFDIQCEDTLCHL